MIILTERLRLRPFCGGDVDAFYKIVQDEQIKKFLPGVYAKTKKEAKEIIGIYKKGDFENDYYLAIEDKRTKTFIGAIIATRLTKSDIETSYFLRDEFRGKGLMNEALTAFSKRFVKISSGRRLIFAVNRENQASLDVMDNVPAKLINTSKEYYYFTILGGKA